MPGLLTPTDRGEHYLTNTRKKTFKKCPRMHYYAYILGVRKDRDGPKRMGTGIHLFLHKIKEGLALQDAVYYVSAVYRNAIDSMKEDDVLFNREIEYAMAIEMEKTLCLGQGWWWRWRNSDWPPVVKSELLFELPTVNPETGKHSRLFRDAGVIDGIVRLKGNRLAIMEHKTVSQDVSSGSTYWKKLRIDTQITDYMIAARRLGYDVSTVLFDVLRKPGIEPLKIPVLDGNKHKIVKDRDGKRVYNKSGTPRQAASKDNGWVLETIPETPKQYGERLMQDIYDRPDFYYNRVEIARGDDELEEVQTETWQIGQDIHRAIKSGHHYRNSDSCMSPFPCDYLDICSSRIDLTHTVPEGYVQLGHLHPELEERKRDIETTASAPDSGSEEEAEVGA